MTSNTPRIAASRALIVLAPLLLVAAAAIGIAGTGPATRAVAGEMPSAPPVAVIPGCLTDDLTGVVSGRGHRAEAVLRLTNTSGRTCQVHGWADVAIVTPPGELVPVPTRRVGTAGAAVVLKPNAGASSAIQWDTCKAGRKGCGAGVAFQYIVDPESTGAVADLTGLPESAIAMKAMRVGPLTAARA